MPFGPVPYKWKRMYERAKSGRSRSAAIRLMCLDCCGWNVRAVDECAATDCPAYAFRTGSLDLSHLRQPESSSGPSTPT